MEKFIKISRWVLVIILALLFISSGYPKIVPGQSMIDRFLAWGYSKNFVLLIGVIELLGGVLIAIPRASFYASLLLFAVMLGAIYTHVSTGIGSPWFAVITAALLGLNMYLSNKINKTLLSDK